MFYKNVQNFKQAFKVTTNLKQRFRHLSRDFRSRAFIPVVLMGVKHREIPYNKYLSHAVIKFGLK